MTRIHTNLTRHRHSAGFTLIEALVALLILSIGLVGLAGLQTLSMRNNYSAFQRSQAVLKAYDALSGDYDRAYAAAVPTQTCTSTCNSTQMAASDLREWVTALQRLPSGDGAIVVDNSGIATVTVRWDDNRDGNVSDVFRLDTQL